MSEKRHNQRKTYFGKTCNQLLNMTENGIMAADQFIFACLYSLVLSKDSVIDTDCSYKENVVFKLKNARSEFGMILLIHIPIHLQV